MKIIWTDNFNRESVADRLVVDNIDERVANAVVEELQHFCRGHGSDWYRTVSDDYRLSRGMENLV